jgi:hypothetical protein
MQLSQKEIRDRAYQFAKEWSEVSRERAEAQTFWNEFFNIFGFNRRRVASFEEPVKKLGQARGSIDLLWKGTLLVEHKSKGQDLDKAYQQALDYFPGLKDQDLPKYVLVSDFARFRLYDLDEQTEHEFTLEQLPDRTHLFGFISGYTRRTYEDQDPVNVQVAEKMGELHDALLESGYTGHRLEQFLVRLIYCLFADDTGIFPKDHFSYFIEQRTREDGADTGQTIATIFQILDTAEDKRSRTLDDDLQQFPYVNGQLFAETLSIPFFNRQMRTLLLECCGFDWSKVSPAIFGSMFQAVMDKVKRRNLGAHYTSEKNILKVVRGLFLDELEAEFARVKNNRARLAQFHERLAGLRFFDPACGCGNFLVITYREVRRLEIEVLKQLHRLSPSLQAGLFVSSIDVDLVYGIELEEFPARIAEVALWLVDHQMNRQLSAEFGTNYYRLPLRKTANIKHANALRLDWASLVPRPQTGAETTLYILGNPPFAGKSYQSAEQKADMELVCGKLNGAGVLDFVSAWYVKAAEFIQGTPIKAAFVSTNSITQGEQVSALWSHLLAQGSKIHFAHRTFKWSNEARGNAQVYCVIIGFAAFDVDGKRLYDYETVTAEPMEMRVSNINPYLIDTDDLVIPTRKAPLCNVPEMIYGNKPVDDGNLFLTDEEKALLLSKEPKAAKFVRPILGSQEFINGESRWCLWLKDVSPVELRVMPEVMKRVEAVKKFRQQSKKAATVKLASVPYLFAEIRQPENDYLLIPRVSSEHRRYIPIGFLTKTTIVNDLVSIVPDATLYHFGVLTSAMHMAWMRQVCGRLKSDYRYSNNLVYNNFPWPAAPTAAQQAKVERAAQAVLDARAAFPDATLADLYDPNAMPKRLLDAHRALDAAVDACYRSSAFKTDLDRLKFLFALYREYTAPLTAAATRTKSRRKS